MRQSSFGDDNEIPPCTGCGDAFRLGSARLEIAYSDRGTLWRIVHHECVLHKLESGVPAPCAEVDLAGGEENGEAILKDRIGETQFLLIPTRRLAGIEDPLIGTAVLPNYWRGAWAARRLVSQLARKELPRDAIGMAINSAMARSQDQLHIHIDCIRPDVRETLSARTGEIGPQWAALAAGLAGHNYRARWIDGSGPEPDPFILLAAEARASGVPMASETLAVIGAQRHDGREGFILLASQASKGGEAHAEDLLDHSCAVARK